MFIDTEARTDLDVRRAKIFVESGRMLGQWWEEPHPGLTATDTIELLAAWLMWELAANSDGILTPDAAKDVYDQVGYRLWRMVD